MTRILWHSQAPWVAGGYGNQTALFAPRLRAAGHNVVVSAYFGLRGSALNWGDLPVWPAGVDDFSNDHLGGYARAHCGGGGLVLTLLDVFVLKNMLLPQFNVTSWLPVDHDPVPPELVHERLETLKLTPIAMSRFGQRKLQEAGWDPFYIPHGVDTSVFQPQNRQQARRAMGVNDSTFVIGMTAANVGTSPPRKAFPEALEAFKQFHDQHPDSVLYLHTELLGGGERMGMDLLRYMRAIGVDPHSVLAVNQHQYTIGLSQTNMAGAYTAMDVLLNPSYGEGFGIPIVEAQACGTPVVVNDSTSMPEICGAGWVCESVPWWHEPMASYYRLPLVGSIVECLEKAYYHAPDQREQAREFAVTYDVDRVFEDYMRPTIKQLEQQA